MDYKPLILAGTIVISSYFPQTSGLAARITKTPNVPSSQYVMLESIAAGQEGTKSKKDSLEDSVESEHKKMYDYISNPSNKILSEKVIVNYNSDSDMGSIVVNGEKGQVKYIITVKKDWFTINDFDLGANGSEFSTIKKGDDGGYIKIKNTPQSKPETVSQEYIVRLFETIKSEAGIKK